MWELGLCRWRFSELVIGGLFFTAGAITARVVSYYSSHLKNPLPQGLWLSSPEEGTFLSQVFLATYLCL